MFHYNNNANVEKDFHEFLRESNGISDLVSADEVSYVEGMEMEFYSEIPKEDGDINLNQLNAQDEEDQCEEKIFIDLDDKKQPEVYIEQNQSCDWGNRDVFFQFESEPENKEQYLQFQIEQQEQTIEVNRVDYLLPLSPGSEYAPSDSISSPESQFLGTYPIIGNNTNELPRVMRTRKTSTKSDRSSISKVIGEVKGFRHRATKAEMDQLDENERKSRKRVQNSKNAKKCVEKKNKEREQQMSLVEERTKQLQIAEAKNSQSMLNIKKEYLQYTKQDNNAPYGDAQNFESILSQRLFDVTKPINQKNMDNIINLLENFNLSEDKLEKVQKKDPNTILSNTLASQKSRAKKALDIAKNKYEAARLQDLIEQEEAKGEELKKIREKFYPGIELPIDQLCLGKKRLPY